MPLTGRIGGEQSEDPDISQTRANRRGKRRPPPGQPPGPPERSIRLDASMLSRIRHSHRARVACCALALFALQAPLRAQQRDPAIEVYGLTGAYFFGNSSNLLKNGEWRPQIALGGLFPPGSEVGRSGGWKPEQVTSAGRPAQPP